MAALTNVIAFRVKEGKSNEARAELETMQKDAESMGAKCYLNWVAAGTGPPGGLALFVQWPDAAAYAKAISGEQSSQYNIRQARGDTALNITQTALLQEVTPPQA